MKEHDYHQHNTSPHSPEAYSAQGLDTAEKSLAEALRISFVILKIIMIVLVVIFLAWGFRTVATDEQAIVLRFGKIVGTGENRLLNPGSHWIFPYPIDEMIKIQVAKKVNLPINSFWYFQSKDDQLAESLNKKTYAPPALDPIREGYCITRGEQHQQSAASGSDDYGIVHSKWQLTYQIDDPEKFYKSIYLRQIKPGESYSDILTQSVNPLLRDIFDNAVVTTMVNYTIDEALLSQDRIPRSVEKLLREKLAEIDNGIKVVSVQLTDITWPRQVDSAFLASIKASQASQRFISEAKGYAENTLNAAAGPAAEQLLASLKTADTDGSIAAQTAVWDQAAGEAQERIAQSRAYRTKIVEAARANAEYLQQILPQYRERPALVVQKIYQDAIEYILDNVDEKMIIQPSKNAKGKELRVLLNRDPATKSKTEKEKTASEN